MSLPREGSRPADATDALSLDPTRSGCTAVEWTSGCQTVDTARFACQSMKLIKEDVLLLVEHKNTRGHNSSAARTVEITR